MAPKYTDEELMLFVEAYSIYGSGSDLHAIKYFARSSGVLKDVLKIPFDELPLHLTPLSVNGWYEACVSVRLKIGR